jgi:serine/threonine protein kinase
MELKVRIFSFDSNKFDLFPKKYQNITSVFQLIDVLRKSQGDPDKPVRLLEDETGQLIVAKFGLGDDILRQPCIEDELLNLKKIYASKIASPHLPDLLWSGKHQEVSKPLVSCVFLCKYIKPFDNTINTLRSLANSGNDFVWRDALFQTLYTIYCLQKKYPGFRHNDLKGDNVLVTKGDDITYSIHFVSSTDPYLKMRRVWKTSNVQVKIIDFELACTPNGETLSSQAVLRNDQLLKDEYGLSSKQCNVFDIHLLLFDTLSACKKTSMYTTYKLFINDFFTDDYLDPICLTKHCRLKCESQDLLQEKFGDNAILKMISHPYFYHCRKESTEPSMFELLL